MWPDIEKIRIYIRPGVTDFRKQINGLTLMARYRMGMDPLSGDLFVFCSRDRRKLKAVYWDRNGFCMWQKRLEKDRFPWPDDEVELRTLSGDELHMLLEGIDFRKRFSHLTTGKYSCTRHLPDSCYTHDLWQ
jgi:transposase